ncbi:MULTISPECIES: AGE family epimerase/isomerase [Kaistia]|uniref:AGE family epimerase/isomerase n=1 Tax=Kaistia nematophila TaxID=2994654 RepID=A0A9X3E089_9HYPH|nr:AGE family epimerase/isomerase [Kaistia nematophila]MBN9026742.1 AGE family epimerase/isomerase [Hyphomicrobiales bacterium]MCX5569130.1 AGE family epimerase/isomerase [Kaistia nematophila]
MTLITTPPWLGLPTHRAWLDDQINRLVRFVQGSRLEAGGFGYLLEDGTADLTRPRELYLNCRLTHVAALAYMRGIPGTAHLIDHGIAAITNDFHDRANGGWFSALEPAGGPIAGRKAAYDHAFVLLAGASATEAGRPGGRELFDSAVAVFLKHFWDEEAGMSRESFAWDFTDSEDYRGANSNMHLVEACLAAGDTSGDAVWYDRALSMADRLINHAARERNWFLPEHFDTQWNPRPEYNTDDRAHPFRPYGSTVGHWLEWSRLLVHIEASLASPPAWLREAATALFNHAITFGWSVDGHDGFVYTTDFEGAVVTDVRMHWALCEGIAAAALLGAVTGDALYEHWYRKLWDHAARYFVEQERGTWKHQLAADLSEAGSVWPGRPDAYHVLNALLLPQLPAAPGAATALARGLA